MKIPHVYKNQREKALIFVGTIIVTMRLMKYIFALCLLTLSSQTLLAQFSYGGGLNLTSFLSFQGNQNRPLNMPGIHATIEIPRNADVTLHGRVSYAFPKANFDTLTNYVTAINPVINPYILAVNSRYKTSYLSFEGGNRYYFGNDYDNGLAGYGGSGLVFSLGTVRKVYDPKDVTGEYSWEQSYQKDPAEISEGKIITLGGFLQGGVKYTIPAIGTIYTDITLNYLILANPSNNAAAATDYFSQMYFNFGVGFKKDLY